MPTRDIIVVGASAGGIEALQRLTQGLPADLPAAVLVVLHTHPTSPGYLPQILSRSGPLPCEHAADGEPLLPGRILVAPPDHHLLIEGEHVRLTRGPKENRSRPAVDPLFRSAAFFYGPRVIGVVLSGMLDDGTAGLWTVKDRSGLAVVQSLQDAQFSSMPESALRHVAVDYQLPSAELGPLLARLARETVPEAHLPPVPSSLEIETRIAMEDSALDRGIFNLGDLSPFTCPECHGVMVQLREGGLLRFRCHTGHAFSASSLLAELTASIEESLWSTMRGMEESGMLMQHMARHLGEQGDTATAARFDAKAKQAHSRAQLMKRLAMEHEQLSEDQLRNDIP
ncbi:MAG TPA: chemotaxis protein CheB [Roseiflexaceae bacterium]|nr:chemotaxis protein CheB [Roseiflexaceae bacterium]